MYKKLYRHQWNQYSLTDTGKNEPKCAVYYIAWCTLCTNFACWQVSSPRLYRFRSIIILISFRSQETTPIIYGSLLFLAFPSMLLVQNFLVCFFINALSTTIKKNWFRNIFKRLKEFSKTNVSLFFSIESFLVEISRKTRKVWFSLKIKKKTLWNENKF